MFNQTDKTLAKLARNRSGYALYNSIGNQLRINALNLASELDIQRDTSKSIVVNQEQTLQAINEQLNHASLVSHYGCYQNEYSIHLKPEELKQAWREIEND